MPHSITILVGTMTGTAELVAQEVQSTLEAAGHAVEIKLMDTLDASVFAQETSSRGVFLICSSTYGNGDVPDNAQAFVASLESQRPDLSAVVFGVIALGDMTYRATFCHGGLAFDRLLTSLGARRSGEPMKHDASSGALPEDMAVDWAANWVDTLDPALEAA